MAPSSPCSEKPSESRHPTSHLIQQRQFDLFVGTEPPLLRLGQWGLLGWEQLLRFTRLCGFC